ncbi:hypothetical protein BX600DRAFT_518992 [Xylariales sp. PMI_506]|nr:hypothetical protein BX600DRAFT_518992 [Xylariales sp. PMI_506]
MWSPTSSLFVVLIALRCVQAQQTGGTYTDPITGFTFQRYVNGGYSFGIAVSDPITNDFIGQFSITNGTEGWAGASIGGTMLNSLLVVSYTDGTTIYSSLRQADQYSNPHLINGTTASLNPIPQGTFVTDDEGETPGSFTYTFLCEGCILTDGRTFATNTTTSPILGWTHSTTALQDPSDDVATLNFHDNYGSWVLNLTGAGSPDFATWASTATPGNGTTAAAS